MAAVMVCSIAVFAQDRSDTSFANDGGISYEFNKTSKTAKVVYNELYTGNITIPAKVMHEGAAYDVTEIANNAFMKTSITTFESSTIKSITSGAKSTGVFRECPNLKSVTMRGLTEITCTALGSDPFHDSKVIVSVSLPDLKRVSNKGDWSGLFCGCFSLAYVDLSSLEEVYSEGLGAGMFRACYVLKEVSLPSLRTVTAKGEGAGMFYSMNLTTALEKVYAPKLETVYSLNSLNNEMTAAGMFHGCKKLTEAILPSITTIGSGMFYCCISLNNVVLSPNITTIQPNTFYKCTSLKSIPYLTKLTSVAEGAFQESGITYALLDSATSVGFNAFTGCGSLRYVAIPNATSVVKLSFLNCSNLEELFINDKVVFASDSFSNCSKLNRVKVSGYAQGAGGITDTYFAETWKPFPGQTTQTITTYHMYGGGTIDDSFNKGVPSGKGYMYDGTSLYYYKNGVWTKRTSETDGVFAIKAVRGGEYDTHIFTESSIKLPEIAADCAGYTAHKWLNSKGTSATTTYAADDVLTVSKNLAEYSIYAMESMSASWKTFTVTYGGGINVFEAPTKVKSTFKGFYTGLGGDLVIEKGGALANVSGIASGGKWVLAGNLRVYAGWEPDKAPILLNDPATGKQQTVNAIIGGTSIIGSVQNRDGYSLVNYVTENGTPVINSLGEFVSSCDPYTDSNGKWVYAVENTPTFNAVWKANTYKVTLVDKSDASAPKYTVNAVYGEPLSKLESTSMHADKFKYLFNGYKLENTRVINKDGTWNEVKGVVSNERAWVKNSDVELYAEWANKEFRGNMYSAAGKDSKQYKVFCNTGSIDNFSPHVKTGYDVAGYADEKNVMVVDGNGKLKAGTEYVDAAGNWNVETAPKLIAVWIPKTTKITFTSNPDPSFTMKATYGQGILDGTFSQHTKIGNTLKWYAVSDVEIVDATGKLVAAPGYVSDGKWISELPELSVYAVWNADITTVTLKAAGKEDKVVLIPYGKAYTIIPHDNPGYALDAYRCGEVSMFGSDGMLVPNTKYANGNREWHYLEKTAEATASWTAKKYDVTLSADGGAGGDKTFKAEYAAAMTKVTDVHTREGYVFAGYTTVAGAGTKVIDNNGDWVNGTNYVDKEGRWIGLSAITFHASWTAKTTSIKLYWDGKEPIDVTVRYDDNSVFGTLHSKKGVNFFGYAKDGASVIINPDKSLAISSSYTASGKWAYIGEKLELSAKYEYKTTIVNTFANESKESPIVMKIGYGDKVVGSFTPHVKDGYGLTGYHMAEGGARIVDDKGNLIPGTEYADADGKWKSEDTTVTLIAHWVAKGTVLTLKSGHPDDKTETSVNVTYGSVLPTFAIHSRTGYAIDGYYAGETKVIGADGKLVSSETAYTTADGKWKYGSATLDLTAKWMVATTLVTLKSGHSGDAKEETVTATFDSDVLTSFTAHSRSGYTLKGYYADTVQVIADGKPVKSNTLYTTADGKWKYEQATLTLTAQWELESTAVTLKSGHSDATEVKITAKLGADAPAFDKHVRAGYALSGYYAGETQVMDADGVLVRKATAYTTEEGKWKYNSETLDLVAHWTPLSTDLTLKSGYPEDVSTVAVKATFDSDVLAVFKAHTRQSYLLKGYYDGEVKIIGADGKLVKSETAHTTADGKWKHIGATLELTAKWDLESTAVTLKSGHAGDANEIKITIKTGEAAPAFVKHARAGFVFNGYYAAETQVIDADGKLAAASDYATDGKWNYGSATLELTAKWTPVVTAITLGSGFEGGVDKTTKATGGSAVLEAFELHVRDQFVLVGYFFGDTPVIDKDGKLCKGSAYADKDGVWCHNGTELALVARWMQNPSVITIKGNSGTDTSVTVESGKDMPAFKHSEKDGYGLTGYYDAAEGGTMIITSAGKLVPGTGYADENGKWIRKGDVTLYAGWKAKEYEVKLVPFAAVGSTKFTAIRDSADMNGYAKPSADKLKFAGYWTTSEGEGVMVIDTNHAYADASGYTSGGKWVGVDGCTLYARWTVMSNSMITYYGNGGQFANGAEVVKTGDTVQKDVPVKDGKQEFMGWAEEPSAKVPKYLPGEEKTFDHDVILYAVWSYGGVEVTPMHIITAIVSVAAIGILFVIWRRRRATEDDI